jgi:hypothetical protein
MSGDKSSIFVRVPPSTAICSLKTSGNTVTTSSLLTLKKCVFFLSEPNRVKRQNKQETF